MQPLVVSGPVTGQRASQDAADIEMQTMHPETGSEEQTVIDSQTSLLELKCWQDLPPEEAGLKDNRWLLSHQPSNDETQLENQEPQ